MEDVRPYRNRNEDADTEFSGAAAASAAESTAEGGRRSTREKAPDDDVPFHIPRD